MKEKLTRRVSVAILLVLLLEILAVPVAAFGAKSGAAAELPNIVINDNGTYTVGGPDAQKYLLGYTAEELGAYEPGDRVNAIVKLEGDSLLSFATAAGMSVSDYAKTAAGKAAAASILAAQDKVIRELGSKISDVGYRYSTVFSGFSCTMEYRTLSAIEKTYPGAKAMIAERYETDVVATDNALNAYGTGIYNSSEAGYTGQGMVVAVLDTGLDYTHTAFQRLPDGEVRMTADDVEELYPTLKAAGLNATCRWEECYYSDKVVYMYDYADKDADVYPVNDHGTHVAGIIAGKDDVITGVAIDAQLAIMKVFSNEDAGAETEDLLAALEDCVLLGVDVINMSLGSSCGFSRDTDEKGVNEVYDAVRAAGINLIVAASNSYSSAKGSNVGDTNRTSNPDSSTLGSPASYDSSLAVASVLGAKSNYLLANGEEPVYLVKAKNNYGDEIEFYEQMLAGKESAEYEYVLVPGIGNDGNYGTVDVNGKIAIIKRGVTTFEEKVQTAAAHGAIGAIIYNNVSGSIIMTIGVATLPTCSISMDAGTYFVDHPTGTLNLGAGNLAGPFMSDFSSWGPNPDLVLTPDLTSYGGDINSAVRGGYDILSGTSMACPNLAGSAALVRQYVKETYPTYTPDEVTATVNRLLMSTSSILRNEAGNPYSPRKQGAGLADAERAVNTGAYLLVDGIDKSKLSLGDDPEKTGEYSLVFHIKNITDHTLSYVLDTLTMTETVSSDEKTVAEQAFMLSPAVEYAVSGGSLLGKTVAVSGYGDATVTVKVRLSDADREYIDKNFVNGMYVEGFVTLKSTDGDADLTIPYLAFYGDWTKAPLLDVTAFEEAKEAKNPAILEDEKLKADVYATLPMVGFYSGNEVTYYYMCKPLFVLADGYEAPAPLEDYCALTTSVDGNFQLKYIAAGLLRNAKTVHMTITDPVTGEVIFEKTTDYCRKSYYNGAQTGGYIEVEFDASTAGLANNTKYVFDMTCELDWEGEQNNLKNNFSFTFYMDDESPVVDFDQTVLRTEKDKDGKDIRYLLDLYVYDNRFLSGLFISTYDEVDEEGVAIDPENVIDGFIPVDDMVAATSNKITLDLTSIWHKLKDGATPGSKNIRFEMYDYAKNSSVVLMTLEKIDAETVNFKNGRKTTEKGDDISFTVAPNKQLNLAAPTYLVLAPEDNYFNALTWESSDENIATVKDGVVTAIANGTCTITATSASGASATVTINCVGKAASADIPVSGLSLNSSALALVRGEKYELYATVSPWNASTAPELTWSTSSPYVTLTVDPANSAHCTVLAAKSGSATVSVKAVGTLFSAACRVGIAEEYELTGSLLQSYKGKGDENGVVEIPDDKGIMYISRLAFYNNKDITKVIIPEGVEEIQYAAFYGCENLKEIVLPASCKKIDEWSFGHNEKLEKINLGHVESIGQLCFYGDKALKEADLSSCHTVCDRAFSFCESLSKVDISHVGQIGKYCFVYCTALEELITSPINKIPDYAFASCAALRSLDMYATYIGEFAFYYCSNLTDVIFHSDVLSIGECAFYYASGLTNVSFKKTCKYIDGFSFANCSSLTSITVPAGCEYLGDYAFGAAYNTKTINFSAGANIRSIGINPFYLCYQVENFTVDPGSKYLTVKDGILYDKNMTKLILMPFAKSLPTLYLPKTVTEIGDYALSTVYYIGTIDLGNVEKVGYGAFESAGIQMVEAGNSLREIGGYAFASCLKLEPIALPSSLVSIGEYAFAGSSAAWGKLTLPATLETLGNYAFTENTGIREVTVPAALAEIPEGAFALCTGLETLTVEEGVTSVGDFAFLGDAKLSTVSLPASLETIGKGAFAECTALVTLTLPENVTEIPDLAFYGDTLLERVNFSDNVTSIGAHAFRGDTALPDFDFRMVETVGDYAFANTGIDVINAPEVKTIGNNAFAGTKLKVVSLPSATDVGARAFYEVATLETIAIPLAVTVGDYAFANTGLSTMLLPACETLGDGAFSRTALTEISLPAIRTIGSYAFYNTKLTSLSLPATLEEVKPNAFTTKAHTSADDTITRIASIELAAESESFFLDDGVLYRYLTPTTYLLVSYPSGKTGTSYTVKEGTVRIAPYAFSTNVTIEDVTLARTVKYIGTGAFYGCTALSSLKFLSVVAPTLESSYSSASADGWTYNNFVSEIGDALSLDVTVPANAVGYDSLLWSHYIGETASSGVISMTDSTAYLIESIDKLPDNLTLADAASVDYLEKVLGATDAEQKKFVTNIAKLNAAISKIAQLRDELPDEPENPGDPDGPDEPTPPDDGGNGGSTVLVIVLIVAGVLLAGGAVAFVLIKKKKGGKADEN